MKISPIASRFPARLLLAASAGALLAACGGEGGAPAAPEPPAPAETVVAEDPSEAIAAFFAEAWEARVARSPEFQTYLGRKTNYDKWDDPSDAFAVESHEMFMDSVAAMKDRFDPAALTPEAELSYRMYAYNGEEAEALFPYRNHWYRFSQFYGPHSSIPPFLINQHRVDTVEDAEAYIARLAGVADNLAGHRAVADMQVEQGIQPPAWAYPQMIATARNVITGAPFDAGEPSALLADFMKKVEALEIDEETRADLVARAGDAMMTSVKPAYEETVAMFERHAETASGEDGAWKLPDGEGYYAAQLKRRTTTDMTASEIHELGLAETARIHAEMDAIREAVGFDGDLKAFFAYMREDPDGKFTYPNDDEGRARYLAEATALIDDMRGRLDELFLTKPKAELIVKRVEPFREQAAGKAFYQRPAADGSRPGIYYANLYDMASMPTYQMAALAYHEGIPGHHMQIAIQQELENMPDFRRFGFVTAYSEGWGLYSELIPKEMGLYEDPYSDFGRLAMELWRAGRLVVDTGLHDKQWTREEAIEWLVENTPNPRADCVKAIERYIVMPGQATAYKIGMLKILELRERARAELGEAFDIRAFHDVVLKDGPVPMAILEENVDAWVAGRKAS